MPYPFPYGEQVIVLDGTVTGQDADGNDIALFPPKATYDSAAVAPADANAQVANEFQNARDLVTIGLTVYLPVDADVTSVDRVLVRGEEYVVQGQPMGWHSPYTNRDPGKAVALGRWTG